MDSIFLIPFIFCFLESFCFHFLRFSNFLESLSQKKKGFTPSSLPLAPEKVKAPRFSFSANKGRASLISLLEKKAKMHYCIFLTPFFHHARGENKGHACA
ncbi:hypothetical protein CQA49_09230 [Helicobacter sp. MIT 00-7814]|nr:hypothetical protein CQA49_09230 [Helicobacter sp. MIT 00-7814]RDU52379.1 hypothetical protein CQA37_08595 [Helicobacter sp. MIT 99-10781]